MRQNIKSLFQTQIVLPYFTEEFSKNCSPFHLIFDKLAVNVLYRQRAHFLPWKHIYLIKSAVFAPQPDKCYQTQVVENLYCRSQVESAAIWLVGFSQKMENSVRNACVNLCHQFLFQLVYQLWGNTSLLSPNHIIILSLEVKESFIEYYFSFQSVIAKNLIIYYERRVNIFVNSFRGRDVRFPLWS